MITYDNIINNDNVIVNSFRYCNMVINDNNSQE